MPFKYPWIEIIAAFGSALLAWRFTGTAVFSHWFVFLGFILAITTTDMQAKLIPPEVTWLGTVVGAILTMIWPMEVVHLMDQSDWLLRLSIPLNSPQVLGLATSVSGAVAGGMLMELIRRIFGRMVNMEVMGFGDTLIMIMIGAFIGPKLVILSLFPACLIGVLLGSVHRIMFGVPHTPFGPALAGGGLLMLVFNDWVIKGIAAYQSGLRNLSGSALTLFSVILLAVAFFLIWRIRQKRLEYEQQIEEDYQRIEEKIQH